MKDNLTIGDLMDAAQWFANAPKPLVGIVCQPQLVGEMELLSRETAGDMKDDLMRELCRVPVYTKPGQTEPYRLFYDHDALRTYLKS